MSEREQASAASTSLLFLSVPVSHVRTYAACLHGHRSSDDVFKVPRQLGDGRAGRMLRGIPAIETFQFMKCANQATGEEEEGQRLEGNGIARPGPDHLIWEEREEGISGIEKRRKEERVIKVGKHRECIPLG